MSKITKPDISIQWAQAGVIVAPSDAKKQAGWVVEKPAYDYMNWLQNRQDTGIAYLYQMGIPEWDSATEYQYAAGYATYIQYNGIVYKALQVSTNKNPASETSYWVRAFDSYGSASTVNTALNNHIANYGLLANLVNSAVARSNLSVYSMAEVVAGFAPIAGNSAQTFLVGNASSANHAVRKSQFDAKTGQATETVAGIAEIATNAEALAGASDTVVLSPLKLQYVLNNKSATTTAKGVVELATNAETITGTDTSRAVTPSNVTGLFADSGRVSLGTNGYQKLPSGLIIQWGSGLLTSGGTVSFPTAFPNACVSVQVTPDSNNAVSMELCSVRLLTQTTFTFDGAVLIGGGAVTTNLTAYWFAIGY